MQDNGKLHIAEVVIAIPSDAPFSYLIPDDMADALSPGVQVTVPFGQSYTAGIVLKTNDLEEPPADYALKPIHDVVSPQPFVGPDILKLLQWIASYYICHLGEAFRLIHPSLNIKKSRLEFRRLNGSVADTPQLTDSLDAVYQALTDDAWFSLEQLERKLKRKNLLYRTHKLVSMGVAEKRYSNPDARKAYKTIAVHNLLPETDWPEKARNKYLDSDSPKYARGRELIAYLQTNGASRRPDLEEKGFSSDLIRRLLKETVIDQSDEEVYRQQTPGYQEAQPTITLSDEQQQFVDLVEPALRNGEHKTYVLHGITGSGKTQVYIELILKALEMGRQAIVLIPEIVLTPQTLSRFYHYFGDKVAAIHSRLSRGERLEVLQKAREGKISVVVGPRSAIFAPFNNLGLIVIDEEHESSFKQVDSQPRYHAREVAIYRAHLNNIPIVLGSASPSFETLYNAEQKKFTYFHLGKRISSRNLPRTRLVDNRAEWRRAGAFQLLSENTLLQLESRLLTREQSMLLLNRRGFSPYIQCQECGFVAKCPNCDITLTYHSTGKNLRCHYCDHTEHGPSVCPDCQGTDIVYQGVGTQKLEQEAARRFPHARFLRMDQDTTRRKGDHVKLLEKFRRAEADVLIGTKMIAKGLDFERVTLVGIINADQGLHFPDFRSAEKVFQLLMQAAGRAGRGARSGEVLIQTFDPNHYIYRYLVQHDYINFYRKEIASRSSLKYPPYSRLCLIRIVADREELCVHFGNRLAKFFWQAKKDKGYQILGPAPAPLAKINNRYRYQILLKQDRKTDPSLSYLRHLLKESVYKSDEVKGWPVEIQIDIDPVDIL